MSSETAPSKDADLPPAMASMWRLCKLGYRHEPALMAIAFGLALLAALPEALLAVGFAFLADAVLDGDRGQVVLVSMLLGAAAVATWFLTTLSTRVQRRFRDRVTIALESHVARLQASVATIAHQERPDHLDRLSILRDQVFVLDHMYMAVFSTAGWILRVTVTVVILAAISPVLLLLALFAIPTVLTSSWRAGVQRDVEEAGAPARRLAEHLFQTATTAPPAKEVRVTGIQQLVGDGRRASWERWYGPVARTRRATAVWQTLGWAIFGIGYVGAVVYVASVLDAPTADVLLVLAAGSRLSAYIAATVGEIGFLRGIWMDGAQRLAWLEDYADAVRADADVPVPERLTEGITFEQVSFAYPGTEREVLVDVDLTLPAGAVVAVVGENGAGKSTLVKLLSKFYAPTAGRILVDGADLGRMPAGEWRDRLAGAYQDFFRFELLARQSIGVGDVPFIDDEDVVAGAADRAGASDVVERFPDGLSSQLGATWPDGVEVSFGQWQKLALARGFMRRGPLVLVLDEPTAALDAETEHALFERYAQSAREAAADGRITILVSHRFSTVRMADLIVVLDGAYVVEVGSHEELVARGGAYAELYGIQAAAYR
jgi:ATP-binding cassette subfamily B protein